MKRLTLAALGVILCAYATVAYAQKVAEDQFDRMN